MGPPEGAFLENKKTTVWSLCMTVNGTCNNPLAQAWWIFICTFKASEYNTQHHPATNVIIHIYFSVPCFSARQWLQTALHIGIYVTMCIKLYKILKHECSANKAQNCMCHRTHVHILF